MATQNSRHLWVIHQFGPQKRELFFEKLPDVRSVRFRQHIIEHDESPSSFSKGVEIAFEFKSDPVKAFTEPWILTANRCVFGPNKVMVPESEVGRQISVVIPNFQKPIDELLGCREIQLR